MGFFVKSHSFHDLVSMNLINICINFIIVYSKIHLPVVGGYYIYLLIATWRVEENSKYCPVINHGLFETSGYLTSATFYGKWLRQISSRTPHPLGPFPSHHPITQGNRRLLLPFQNKSSQHFCKSLVKCCGNGRDTARHERFVTEDGAAWCGVNHSASLCSARSRGYWHCCCCPSHVTSRRTAGGGGGCEVSAGSTLYLLVLLSYCGCYIFSRGWGLG